MGSKLTEGYLEVFSRPAGDFDSHWLRCFKQRAESHLVVMFLDIYLVRLQ